MVSEAIKSIRKTDETPKPSEHVGCNKADDDNQSHQIDDVVHSNLRRHRGFVVVGVITIRRCNGFVG